MTLCMWASRGTGPTVGLATSPLGAARVGARVAKQHQNRNNSHLGMLNLVLTYTDVLIARAPATNVIAYAFVCCSARFRAIGLSV